MVEKAIYSILAADYPRDRLEVFVIDDGSTDDTWTYIQRAAMEYPHLVTAFHFLKNRGKRVWIFHSGPLDIRHVLASVVDNKQ